MYAIETQLGAPSRDPKIKRFAHIYVYMSMYGLDRRDKEYAELLRLLPLLAPINEKGAREREN